MEDFIIENLTNKQLISVVSNAVRWSDILKINGITKTDVILTFTDNKNTLINNNEVFVLPIMLNTLFTGVCNHVFLLSILSAYPLRYEWFYENFIQISTDLSSIKGLHLNFAIESNSIFSKKSFSVDEVIYIDYIEKILEFIKDGNYIIQDIDEYYIQGKEVYQIKHNIHHNLIYGFDNNYLKTLSLYPYGYEFADIKFQEYFNAYLSCSLLCESDSKRQHNKFFSLYKIKNANEKYSFNIDIFKCNLKDYVNSSESIGSTTNQYRSWGINTYNFIIRQLEEKNKMLYQYFIINSICEHKNHIFNCIKQLKINDKTKEKVLNDYNEILKIVRKMKIFQLKSSIGLQKKSFSKYYNIESPEFTNKLIEDLMLVRDLENQCLTYLLEQI